MNSRDFGVVGLKIFAIYLFTKGVNHLLTSISLWSVYSNQAKSVLVSTSDTMPSIVVSVSFLITVFYLAAAHLLWMFTGKIVGYVLPEKNDRPDETKKEKIAIEDLEKTAFAVVGVVILSYAIPNLFHAAADVLHKKAFLTETILDIIGHLVYLGIGLFLLYGGKDIEKFLSSGGKGLLKFIKKLRR